MTELGYNILSFKWQLPSGPGLRRPETHYNILKFVDRTVLSKLNKVADLTIWEILGGQFTAFLKTVFNYLTWCSKYSQVQKCIPELIGIPVYGTCTSSCYK